MTTSNFIRFEDSQLHYMHAGNGEGNLLFFHGFGQDHTVYLPIIKSLSNRFNLYIFDLYFHGQSTWAFNEKPLEKSTWKETMNQFLIEKAIQNFSVVGFSLGGKFALATLESFPQRCKKIFLLAPDGIHNNFWYRAATYPWITRSFFKSLINNYERFEKLTALLIRFKLADAGLIRFADYQMGTEPKRKRVYYSWVVFRHLTFNLKQIATIINEHKIETTLVVGRYDKVIPPHAMEKFVKLVPNIKYDIIEMGHSGLLSVAVLSKYIKT